MSYFVLSLFRDLGIPVIRRLKLKRIKLTITEMLLLVGLFFSASQVIAQAAPAIAAKLFYVDEQMAILESDAVKKYKKDSDLMFEPRTKKLKTSQESINSMKEKFLKEAPALSEIQRAARELEIKRMDEDLRIQIGELNNDRSRSDQEVFAKINAKLEKAVEEVAKQHGPNTAVLRKAGVSFMDSKNDITRKVIERLNQMK